MKSMRPLHAGSAEETEEDAMFGYVTPLKCELRVREQTLYEAWYCGLCRAIGARYGQLPRLTLDYDCTFLALLLAAVSGGAGPCAMGRCGLKPLRREKPMAPAHPALDYAADCNVLLAHAKLEDDWRDEKKPLGLAGKLAFGRAARKAKAERPTAAAAIEAGVAALSKEEAAGCAELDRAADAFAGLLRGVLAGYAPLSEREREILGWLGYHLGRWVYLIDAWEDRGRDQAHGAYNPFLASGAGKERAEFLLYASLSEVEKAFDLLDLSYAEGLLDNIVHLGCRARTRQVLGGEGA